MGSTPKRSEFPSSAAVLGSQLSGNLALPRVHLYTCEVLFRCHNCTRKKLLLPKGLCLAAHGVTKAQDARKDTETGYIG